jgi:hypothetical protein
MQVITSKKELYKLLPKEYQGVKTQKLIGKVFSIGASNYWTVQYHDLVLIFTYENEYIHCSGQVNLRGLTTVPEIPLNQVLFKQSGLQVTLNFGKQYSHHYFLTSDNQILSCGLQSYYSLHHFCLHHKRSDFVSVGTSFSAVADSIIKNNPDCFRKLEWNEFYSYSGVLCTKDCGYFRKGMILDTYYQHLQYHYFTRSPLDLVGNGQYAGLYRINNCLSCDLSKVTIQELEAVSCCSFSCSKQNYGCQRGCITQCYADSANKNDILRKDIFIKLWKECFQEK